MGLSARLVTVHADVHRVMAHAAAREIQQLTQYLAGLLNQLASAGADIAAIPAFAPQVCATELAAVSPLPLISLLDVIAAEVTRKRFRKVALFGARVTMETRLFGALPQVEVVMPTSQEIDTIAETYSRVVEQAGAAPRDYNQLRSLAHRLIDRDNLDAIILAGTDLAFVFEPDNTNFAHIDGARLHIAAIMREIAPGYAALAKPAVFQA